MILCSKIPLESTIFHFIWLTIKSITFSEHMGIQKIDSLLQKHGGKGSHAVQKKISLPTLHVFLVMQSRLDNILHW